MEGSKSILSSKGVWGGLIAIIAGALPFLGPMIGFNVTPEVAGEVATSVNQIIVQVTAVIGGVLAIIGRIKATKQIG